MIDNASSRMNDDLDELGRLPELVAQCFRSSVVFEEVAECDQPHGDIPCVRIERVASRGDDVRRLHRDVLPLLIIPSGQRSTRAHDARRVIVSLEGRDVAMASEVAGLLDPEMTSLELVHVTWLTGLVTTRIPESGLDNPHPTDILLYEGATEALIDTADALREQGFTVSTHLRFDRHPGRALGEYVLRRPCAFVVLGLGRHGAGIGRDLLRRSPVPILYVNARA